MTFNFWDQGFGNKEFKGFKEDKFEDKKENIFSLNNSSSKFSIFKIFKWGFLFLAIVFIILIIVRVAYFISLEKTNAQIKIIHNSKIDINDVIGEHLPKDPGSIGNKRIEGVDENKNGIRDDVELAIFRDYPGADFIKIRASLLQYAMALQSEMTQPFVNEEIATKAIVEENRADLCVADTVVPRATPESTRTMEEVDKSNEYTRYVKNLQINTKEREKYREYFFTKVRSYGESENEVCDIQNFELSK